MCSKFLLSSSRSFRNMRGSQIYTRGATWPYRNVCRIFKFLALVVSEIWGGPKFTLERCGPRTPLAKKISSWKEYFALSICVQNFDFLALVIPEIWGGSKFTLGALRPPRTFLTGKIFIPEKSTWSYQNVCRSSTF